MSETAIPNSDSAIIRMDGITRRFAGIVANDDVNLQVRKNAFHAVIGENGAGKSTLLNILYGWLRPDSGRICIGDEDVTHSLRSPSDAIRRGIGLVSQHYSLIPALSVIENVILGVEPMRGGMVDWRRSHERARGLAAQLGLESLDLDERADRLTIAAGQKVEILKLLYRDARILLLDEPTATLAPLEAESLFSLLRRLVEGGATIVFVTHKLREVMDHSDAVTVLRGGKNTGDFLTRDVSKTELLTAMMGVRDTVRSLAAPAGGVAVPRRVVLRTEGATVRGSRRVDAARDVSFEVAAGETVGVAGVDGSGQRELSEAIVGLRRCEAGAIVLDGADVTHWSVRRRQHAGLAYIPEDRHRSGMILDFSIAENYLLGHEFAPEWGGGGALHAARLKERAAAMIREYDVRVGAQGAAASARSLSGGNQQKVVAARALDSSPRLLVACQPTRGLDIEATQFVHDRLRASLARGVAILLFSLDLDEILALSDRVAVMFNGRLAGILDRSEATPESLGALMTGSVSGGAP